MTDYEKQKVDLIEKFAKGELGSDTLINIIVETRKQRDYYKGRFKDCKKANHKLRLNIEVAASHIGKAKKKLINKNDNSK